MGNIKETTLTRLIEEIVNEKNTDQLFDVVFKEEARIDTNTVVDMLNACLVSIKGELAPDEYESANEYIVLLASNNQEMDYILLKIASALSKGLADKDLATITSSSFWTLFAIACKKSISMPTASFENSDVYYSQVSTDTPQQQRAHEICFSTFELDACRFNAKVLPGLNVFLHPIRSKNKKIRTKKKNLHRVLKATKRVMQAHKITHRNDNYNYFMGKSYIVPEEFTRTVVKSFLSE